MPNVPIYSHIYGQPYLTNSSKNAIIVTDAGNLCCPAHIENLYLNLSIPSRDGSKPKYSHD